MILCRNCRIGPFSRSSNSILDVYLQWKTELLRPPAYEYTDCSKKMAKDDLIFCLGSDVHRPRAAADLIKAQAKLGRYYDEAGLKQILEKNPRKILR